MERPARPAGAAPEQGPGTDPLTAIGIQTLSQAVEMLRQDVEHERDRADRAEQQVEVERQLGDEGRKRVDGLISELADTSTAAMIRGCEAAALRTLLALLTNPPALVAKVVPVTDLDPDLHAELERLGPANVREALRRTPLGCVRGV